MAQKPNKPEREHNGIKIDMNVGKITDRNFNVIWLRSITIPVTAPQVPSHMRNPDLSIP